ncbi:MAG: UvrD-helicase domain-containing protein, partial [Alphaproteobacteria bacterium]|nr:UvrD-helicase domain-containing protein [Alphaproteobacteria bacterium]
ILVDEYQDTNVAQYLWLRLLAQGTADVCCVGDDDQSIYGWRGAEVGNILRFEKDFPGSTIVRLERNYRSTPHILAAASHLISHNDGRLGKTLWTGLRDGERISLRGVWDGDEEARQVGEEIEALQRDKHPLSQIAILVRAGFQTREFEERFITLGLPYRVIGGPRFYERAEIRDAMAYCRVTAQSDDDLAFERIYNTPRRGLGESALATLRSIQRSQKVSLYEATRRALETDELKARPRKSLGDLIRNFDRWRGMLEGMSHVEVVETMLDESGYTDMLRADRSPEAEGRLENLKEFVNALQEFDTLPAFLEHVALLTDNAEKSNGDMVSVMTLHAAKGLEFDTVFLPGWEEGLFPNQRALDDKGLAGLEEERRLAYVGLTRARKRAYVSFAANRRVFNQWQAAIPSRFLKELPTDQLAESSDAGLYATYSAGHHGGLRDQASGFDYESLGVTHMGRGRTRWRDETFDDRRAVEGDKPDLSIGQRVFHQKFGYGRIVAVDGNKLDIEFEKAGPKKVLDSFIEAA